MILNVAVMLVSYITTRFGSKFHYVIEHNAHVIMGLLENSFQFVFQVLVLTKVTQE